MSTSHTPGPSKPYIDGSQHFRAGIPRKANPYLLSAYNNGARKPWSRPSVQQWFAGWDMARIQQESCNAD